MKGLNTKSVIIGVVATLVVIKFIAPRVPALQSIVSKVS